MRSNALFRRRAVTLVVVEVGGTLAGGATFARTLRSAAARAKQINNDGRPARRWAAIAQLKEATGAARVDASRAADYERVRRAARDVEHHRVEGSATVARRNTCARSIERRYSSWDRLVAELEASSTVAHLCTLGGSLRRSAGVSAVEEGRFVRPEAEAAVIGAPPRIELTARRRHSGVRATARGARHSAPVQHKVFD